MKVLIIEDEYGAAQNLKALLNEISQEIQVLAVIETVKGAVHWINNNSIPDLAFFDIQLADGLSFEIFEQIQPEFPIIFTTAFNEYAIRAFKVNSIDYLLKPLSKKELSSAIDKYNSLHVKVKTDESKIESIFSVLSEMRTGTYKKSFLIHHKDRIVPVPVNEITYFMIDAGRVKCLSTDNSEYIMDYNLDEIEKLIDPEEFYRANRQFIVSRSAIKEVSIYFTGRLKLTLTSKSKEDIIISKGKVAAFKQWLDR